MIASTGTALFNSKPPPDIVVAVHLTTLDSLCHPRAMTMAKLSFYAHYNLYKRGVTAEEWWESNCEEWGLTLLSFPRFFFFFCVRLSSPNLVTISHGGGWWWLQIGVPCFLNIMRFFCVTELYLFTLYYEMHIFILSCHHKLGLFIRSSLNFVWFCINTNNS